MASPILRLGLVALLSAARAGASGPAVLARLRISRQDDPSLDPHIVELRAGDGIDETVKRFCSAHSLCTAGDETDMAIQDSLWQQVHASAPVPGKDRGDGRREAPVLLDIPLMVDDRSVVLSVRRGISVQRTLELFKREHNIQDDGVELLGGEIRKRLSALAGTQDARVGPGHDGDLAAPAKVLAYLELSVRGEQMRIELLEGEDLPTKVRAFCAENGLTDERDIRYLVESFTALRESGRVHGAPAHAEQAGGEAAPPAQTDERRDTTDGEDFLSVRVAISGQEVALRLPRSGDRFEHAKEFCQLTGLGSACVEPVFLEFQGLDARASSAGPVAEIRAEMPTREELQRSAFQALVGAREMVLESPVEELAATESQSAASGAQKGSESADLVAVHVSVRGSPTVLQVPRAEEDLAAWARERLEALDAYSVEAVKVLAGRAAAAISEAEARQALRTRLLDDGINAVIGDGLDVEDGRQLFSVRVDVEGRYPPLNAVKGRTAGALARDWVAENSVSERELPFVVARILEEEERLMPEVRRAVDEERMSRTTAYLPQEDALLSLDAQSAALATVLLAAAAAIAASPLPRLLRTWMGEAMALREASAVRSTTAERAQAALRAAVAGDPAPQKAEKTSASAGQASTEAAAATGGATLRPVPGA